MTPTPRQINNASNLACKTVMFEGRDLTALEAVCLDDELVERMRQTMASTDHKRRSDLHCAIWAAHNAAVKSARSSSPLTQKVA